jgi:hypothetical protein
MCGALHAPFWAFLPFRNRKTLSDGRFLLSVAPFLDLIAALAFSFFSAGGGVMRWRCRRFLILCSAADCLLILGETLTETWLALSHMLPTMSSNNIRRSEHLRNPSYHPRRGTYPGLYRLRCLLSSNKIGHLSKDLDTGCTTLISRAWRKFRS